ncbi:MAG: hypothetical protein R3D02_11240 [Hyphomicrobiales bacterium]
MALAHDLSQRERSALTAIVVGAVPGNRDRPLFRLAGAVARAFAGSRPLPDGHALINLLAEALGTGRGPLHRLDAALLDFLLSMDGFAEAAAVEAAAADLVAEPQSAEAMRACANGFARALYRYRAANLPAERHRAKFADIRRFLSTPEGDPRSPGDGDPLAFWCEFASRENWTLYETVLDAFLAYEIARETSRAAAPVGSIRDPDDNGQSAWERSETQLLAYRDLDEELDEALSELAASDLKIFKETETARLKKLLHLGRFARNWPRATLCLLALSPHQASLVQLVKDRAEGERLSDTARCCGGDNYPSVIGALLELDATAAEATRLADALRRRSLANDSCPDPSKPTGDAILRESRLMRRKSFKMLDADKLGIELDRLTPALAVLRGFLGTVQRGWKAWSEERATAAFRDDRERFAAKLHSLYLVVPETSDAGSD